MSQPSGTASTHDYRAGGGNETFPFGQPIVWQPDPAVQARSNLQRFMQRHGIGDYANLQARAVADIAWFWDAVMEDMGIEFYRPYSQIVDLRDGMEFPRWCVDGEKSTGRGVHGPGRP